MIFWCIRSQSASYFEKIDFLISDSICVQQIREKLMLQYSQNQKQNVYGSSEARHTRLRVNTSDTASTSKRQYVGCSVRAKYKRIWYVTQLLYDYPTICV